MSLWELGTEGKRLSHACRHKHTFKCFVPKFGSIHSMRIVSVTDVENVYLWNMCVIASIVVESSDHMYCSAFGSNEPEWE